MVASLPQEDCETLSSEFPELICSISKQVIWGSLSFSCSHILESGTIHIGCDGPNKITDAYEIRIDFSSLDRFGCPKVFEESGRVIAWAESEGIDPMELHINEDDNGSCCRGIFPNFIWHSAIDFIHNFVVPFFYWQSFRAKNGTPPWDGHAHGDKGIEEALSMPRHEATKARNRNITCPCGSRIKYKKCCLQTDRKLLEQLTLSQRHRLIQKR